MARTTYDPDRDYVADLINRVEQIQRSSPPRPQPIKGDGFVMFVRSQAPRPASKRRDMPMHLILGALGGLAVCLPTLVFLYFFGPTLFNM
jgi:hypothetical protein